MPQNWPWTLLQTQPAGAGVQACMSVITKVVKSPEELTYALDNLGGLCIGSGSNHAGENDEGGSGDGEELGTEKIRQGSQMHDSLAHLHDQKVKAIISWTRLVIGIEGNR
jgi:hypothetical protein